MSHLDDIIRDKLANLQAQETPQWGRLQERLDADAFDDALRTALPSTGMSHLALGEEVVSQWATMSDKLDQLSAIEADSFDRIIAHKLATTETDLAPTESWRQLSHRIDTLWPLRRVLVRYRALEIAAAIALFFTFLPLLRDNPIWNKLADLENVASNSHHEPAQAIELGSKAAQQEPAVRDGVNGDLLAALGLDALMDDTQLLNPLEIASLYDTDRTLGSFPPANSSRTAAQKQNSALDNLISDFLWNTAQLSLPTQNVTALDQVGGGFGGFGASRANSIGKVLDQKKLELLPLGTPSVHIPAPVQKAKAWNYGVSGGVKVWRIYTPADPLFEVGAAAKHLTSPQISMHAVHNLTPRVRLGASASVTSLAYDPGLPTVLRRGNLSQGSSLDYSERFESISIDMGQAVVDLRYGLLPAQGKTQIWAKVGLGAGLVLRSAYDVRRNIGQIDQDLTPPNPQNTPQGFAPKPQSAEPVLTKAQSYSDVKDFPYGVLQGGEISDNRQVFGRLGLETEIKVGPRVSLFGGLDYDAFLPLQRGFGPNNDEFTSLSAELGARINL